MKRDSLFQMFVSNDKLNHTMNEVFRQMPLRKVEKTRTVFLKGIEIIL